MIDNISDLGAWKVGEGKKPNIDIPTSGMSMDDQKDLIKEHLKDEGAIIPRVVLNLCSSLYAETFKAEERSKEFNVKLKQYKKDLGKTDRLILGAMLFFGVSFLGFISTLWYDAITDKKLYDQKYNLYKDYSEEKFKLFEEIKNQNMNIKALENQVNQLKIKEIN